MTRGRWAACLAGPVAVLLAALGLLGDVPAGDAPAPPPAAAEARSGSISARPGETPAIAAVELGRPPVVVRSESRQGGRALALALLAVAMLVAAIGLRAPRLRRLLELSIRSRSTWWQPALGGRAPPRPVAH